MVSNFTSANFNEPPQPGARAIAMSRQQGLSITPGGTLSLSAEGIEGNQPAMVHYRRATVAANPDTRSHNAPVFGAYRAPAGAEGQGAREAAAEDGGEAAAPAEDQRDPVEREPVERDQVKRELANELNQVHHDAEAEEVVRTPAAKAPKTEASTWNALEESAPASDGHTRCTAHSLSPIGSMLSDAMAAEVERNTESALMIAQQFPDTAPVQARPAALRPARHR